MKKFSKRRQEINLKVEAKAYSPSEAIRLLKETATAKFMESTEAHFSLNIDPRYSDQQLRTTLLLPKGTGKTKRVAVLLPTERMTSELEALADQVGAEALIEKMNKGQLDFDILIATPDMMPKLARLGRVLGPKGLMPSPKSGTVTTNVVEAVQEFKQGKLEYRADKTGIVHLSFGKASFSEEDLLSNLSALYRSIEQNKPVGAKGRFFKSLYLCTTMGPSISVDLSFFKLA